jgi:hypothetical protein
MHLASPTLTHAELKQLMGMSPVDPFPKARPEPLDESTQQSSKKVKLKADSSPSSESQVFNLVRKESTPFELTCRAVALSIVSGLNDQQAADFLDMELHEVRQYKENKHVVDLVNQASASASISPENRIARVIPTVIDKKIRTLLTSKDDKLVMAVGTELMDRHFGKPIQTTQSFGVNVMTHTSLEDLASRQSAVTERLAQIEKQRLALKDAKPFVNKEAT